MRRQIGTVILQWLEPLNCTIDSPACKCKKENILIIDSNCYKIIIIIIKAMKSVSKKSLRGHITSLWYSSDTYDDHDGK